MTRPLFCPNCGARLTDPYAAVHLAADETPNAAGVWDTYCAACEWSGDIWPDKESGGVERGVVDVAKPEDDKELGANYDPRESFCRLAEQCRVERGLTADEAIELILATLRGLPIPASVADKVRAAGYGAEVDKREG